MPIITTLLTSATSYMMATDEEDNGSETETSRQQAANDARQNFIDQMNQIFEQILADKTNIRPLTYIPAGTRIIVYPKVDLWLRTAERDAEASTNMKKKDVLIDVKGSSGPYCDSRLPNAGSNRQPAVAAPLLRRLSTNLKSSGSAGAAGEENSGSKSGRAPASSVGATPPPPPSMGGTPVSTAFLRGRKRRAAVVLRR